ncbi:MAG: HTTM domain-containing protein [Candidatus Acidiferrales bacterium]
MRSLLEAWNAFFFAEESPTPIALFRIIYGVLVIATLLLLRPDWLAWYGTHAWVTLPTEQMLEPGTRLNFFSIIPQSDAWIEAFFWVFLGSAALLTIGFLTRLNSVLVFLCLTSIQQRNLFITHGGDTFLRIAGFFLIFAPAGAAISVDHLLRIWRGKEGARIRPRMPWAQRMIQFELSLMYFVTFCWKVEGITWVQGSALYFVYNLDELQRFPVPSWFLHPLMLKLGSWFALALEFSLGILIWIKELRYYLLALGVMFHLFLEYSLNVPMFEWDVLSAYILFVDAADIERAWNWVRVRATARAGGPLEVIYDGGSERNRRNVELLTALDILHRLTFTELKAARTRYDIPREEGRQRILIATRSGLRHGMDGVLALARVVPVLWPLAIPGIVRRPRGPKISDEREAK